MVEAGVLEVIAPPALFYPDLDSLQGTFGDDPHRVKFDCALRLYVCLV